MDLRKKVESIRDLLKKSQANTDEMETALNSINRRISALESPMDPTKLGRSTVHENIDKAINVAQTRLHQVERFLQMNLITNESTHAALKEVEVALENKLAQTAEETVADFEEEVDKDPTRPPTSHEVHPLTLLVMKHVMFLLEYKSTALKQILEEKGVFDAEERLTQKMIGIVEALESILFH